MTHAPSKVFLQYLLGEQVVQTASDTEGVYPEWSAYRSSTPDLPDQVVVLYDTEGGYVGRFVTNGETVIHPSIQLRIRSLDYDTGWRKGMELALLFDVVKSRVVTIEGSTYRIRGISRAGNPLYNGLEMSIGTSNRRRHIFTLNLQVTINED